MSTRPPVQRRPRSSVKVKSETSRSLKDSTCLSSSQAVGLPRAKSRLRKRSVIRSPKEFGPALASAHGDKNRGLISANSEPPLLNPGRRSSSVRQSLASAARKACFESIPRNNSIDCPGDAIFSCMGTEFGGQCAADTESLSAASRSDFGDLGCQEAFLGGHNAHEFYHEEYTDEEEEEGRFTMDVTVTQKPRGKPMVTRQTRSSILSSDFIASCNYTADICEYITFFGVFDPWKNNMLPYWDKIFYNEPQLPFCPINPYTPSYFTCGHYPNRRILFQPPITDPLFPPNLLQQCPNCPRISRKCCPMIL